MEPDGYIQQLFFFLYIYNLNTKIHSKMIVDRRPICTYIDPME